MMQAILIFLLLIVFPISGVQALLKGRLVWVIDKDTKDFPYLSSSLLRRYDKQDFDTWMAKEKEETRHMAEKQGRAKFGDSYKLDDKDNR